MTSISGFGVPVTHVAAPLPDSAYTIGGPRDGRLLDERYMRAFPAEGICSCDLIVRREAKDRPWVHTHRKPGDTVTP